MRKSLLTNKHAARRRIQLWYTPCYLDEYKNLYRSSRGYPKALISSPNTGFYKYAAPPKSRHGDTQNSSITIIRTLQDILGRPWAFRVKFLVVQTPRSWMNTWPAGATAAVPTAGQSRTTAARPCSRTSRATALRTMRSAAFIEIIPAGEFYEPGQVGLDTSVVQPQMGI